MFNEQFNGDNTSAYTEDYRSNSRTDYSSDFADVEIVVYSDLPPTPAPTPTGTQDPADPTPTPTGTQGSTDPSPPPTPPGTVIPKTGGSSLAVLWVGVMMLAWRDF